MEEKNNEPFVSKKKLKGVKGITLLIVAIVIVMILGVNAFATVSGYGNVFFMIKNLVTTGTLYGEEEIFSDKEITLSYKSIDIADGIKVQINKLEILENQSNLYLLVKVGKSNDLPLKYSIKSKGLSEEVTLQGKEEVGENFEYQEKLTINHKFGEDELLTLYVKDKEGNLLTTIDIDLDSREISYANEEKNTKISQIELKKYLNIFAELNNDSLVNDKLLNMAKEIKADILLDDSEMDRETTNQLIKSFYGDKADFVNKNDIEVLNLDNSHSKNWDYDKTTDTYKEISNNTKYKKGFCLKISDISYTDEVYSVEYIYVLTTNAEVKNEKIEELQKYVSKLELKRIENSNKSKYEIITSESGTKISNDEFASILSSEPEEVTHIHNYVVEQKVGHTTLDGTHTVKCTICGEEHQEKHNFNEWYDLGDKWTLWCNDCKSYVYTEDKNVVLNSGYGIKQDDDSIISSEPEEVTHVHDYIVEQKVGHTTLDGTHTVKCTICGEEHQEKHNFNEWYDLGDKWTLWCNDCKSYVYTEDKNVVLNSGYGIKQDDNSNNNQEKYFSAFLVNPQLKNGHNYNIYYYTPDQIYKSTGINCLSDGVLNFEITGIAGEYTLDLITDKNTNEKINFGNGKVTFLEDGTAQTSNFTNVSGTITNNNLVAGKQYKLFYFDPSNNYKGSINLICSQDGKGSFTINGPSGSYRFGTVTDKDDNIYGLQSYGFKIDYFGNYMEFLYK